MASLSSRSFWSSEPVSPREFVQRFPLPQIVKIHEATAQSEVAGAKLDLRQPLLLYRAYKCRKVRACSVTRLHDGDMAMIGPPLMIPENYAGWISVITDDGHTAGYFSSVQEMAASQVQYFLAKEAITGYTSSKVKHGNCMYTRTRIEPGEVIRFQGIYEDVSSPYLPNQSRYGKCVTRDGNVVYLPYNNTGKFYSVATAQSHSPNHVYLLKYLLQMKQLPLTVRIVAGHVPQLHCKLTRVIRLLAIEEKEVILACTLQGKKSFLFEVDMNSAFSFLHVNDTQKACNLKIYNKTLNFCNTETSNWRQQIKVAHHVVPSSFPPGSMETCPSTSYEDQDSAVRSSTGKSISSGDSKKTMSSTSSNFFRRFWQLNKLKPFCTKSKSSRSSSVNKSSKADSHMYESVKNIKWSRSGGSSLVTEILDDDGYATSDFEEDDSVY